MLIARAKGRRSKGRPFKTTRDTFAENLRIIILDLNKKRRQKNRLNAQKIRVNGSSR